jgi:two-component system LytT family response regulator
MRTLIIEDEKINTVTLCNLLDRYCKEVKIIGAADNAADGERMIRTLAPELIFLDIQMPNKTGFDMLSSLGEYDFEVIFVSGYDQYGIQAIKFSALDYLLKPVKAGELIKAVQKAAEQKEQKNSTKRIHNLLGLLENTRKEEHYIGLPQMKEIRLVKPAHIIRCEARNNYTLFYLQNGEKLLVAKGIYEYDEMLKDYKFIRCHQSHLVNAQFVKSMLKEDNVCELLLLDGSRIPVPRTKKDIVKDALINGKAGMTELFKRKL